MQGHAVMHDTRRKKNKVRQIMAERVRMTQETIMDTPPTTPPGIPSRNVRRCLFPDTLDQITRQEFRKEFYEEIKKDRIKMKEKYNFDSVNEVALEGKNYEWYKKVNDEWEYMEPLPVKGVDSTMTPHREPDNRSLPEIGKRKRDAGPNEPDHQAVKKRLSYN